MHKVQRREVEQVEYTTQTITTEKAIIKVHRPILDEAERQRRMHHIMQATERFLKSTQKKGAT
jgi:hypothetical protein